MAVTEVIYPLGTEPAGAACCCGNRNGDTVQRTGNGQPIGEPKAFSQPMVRIGADRWAHVGCWADEAWDRSKDADEREREYIDAITDRDFADDDRGATSL